MSEQAAREMGWVPQEEFRGAPEKWVDAETFVRKGETMLPLLNKHKKELQSEVQTLKQTLAESQAAIKMLQESHDAEVKEKVQEARRNLLANLEQAKAYGDTKLEVKLTEELIELNTAAKEAPKKEVVDDKSGGYENTMAPEFIQFAKENPWFGTDIRKTNKAMGIAQLIRSDPANDHLSGEQFFAKVLQEMDGGGEGSSRVSAGKSSGTGGSGGKGKGYAQLPADAKAACDKQGRSLVGEGKRFKTTAEWQTRYAELYFEGDE